MNDAPHTTSQQSDQSSGQPRDPHIYGYTITEWLTIATAAWRRQMGPMTVTAVSGERAQSVLVHIGEHTPPMCGWVTVHSAEDRLAHITLHAIAPSGQVMTRDFDMQTEQWSITDRQPAA